MKQKIQDCPVCGKPIEADIRYDIEQSKPQVDIRTGEVKVESKATMTRFHVRHSCEGRTEKRTPAQVFNDASID